MALRFKNYLFASHKEQYNYLAEVHTIRIKFCVTDYSIASTHAPFVHKRALFAILSVVSSNQNGDRVTISN